MSTFVGYLILALIIYSIIASSLENKKKRKDWESYLRGLTEKQCFIVANDKSETKFTSEQRSEAYRRGCELRRIRELGE